MEVDGATCLVALLGSVLGALPISGVEHGQRRKRMDKVVLCSFPSVLQQHPVAIVLQDPFVPCANQDLFIGKVRSSERTGNMFLALIGWF